MDTVKKIDTPYNNAVAIINRTNELLNENNVLDSTGTEIAQLEQAEANPAWLFALACGNLHTAWQEKLAKAYACLDPQACEDDQVLVLASLAGIKRGNGTPTHITALIKNTGEETITVPIGTTFIETYANQTWVLNKNLTLGAGVQQYATLYTTVDGEYNVPPGTTFEYSGELSITCVSSSNSSGGSFVESLASLRNRISQGVDSTNFLMQAKAAIELLSGIESCSIWFNSSSENSKTIGLGTHSHISVNITNTSSNPITIPAGSLFVDDAENEQWILQNKLSIEANGQKSVILFSVVGQDITVLSGTNFVPVETITATCVSISDSVFGSVIIPPRTAYISIKGYDYSGKIAETYYTYLDVPATVGDQHEEYLLGQEAIPLNFDYANEVTIKIFITMRSTDMAIGAEGAVKNAVSMHSGTLACGENVSSQMVSEWVQNLGYGTIVGCNVETPTGITSNIGPVEYCVFDEDSIFVNTI